MWLLRGKGEQFCFWALASLGSTLQQSGAEFGTGKRQKTKRWQGQRRSRFYSLEPSCLLFCVRSISSDLPFTLVQPWYQQDYCTFTLHKWEQNLAFYLHLSFVSLFSLRYITLGKLNWIQTSFLPSYISPPEESLHCKIPTHLLYQEEGFAEFQDKKN